jgi:hypothetical protein
MHTQLHTHAQLSGNSLVNINLYDNCMPLVCSSQLVMPQTHATIPALSELMLSLLVAWLQILNINLSSCRLSIIHTATVQL